VKRQPEPYVENNGAKVKGAWPRVQYDEYYVLEQINMLPNEKKDVFVEMYDYWPATVEAAKR